VLEWVAVEALHLAALAPLNQLSSGRRQGGWTACGGKTAFSSAEGRGAMAAEEILLHAAADSLQRGVYRLSPHVSVVTARGEGCTLVLLANAHPTESVAVDAIVYCKANVVRSAEGLLANDVQAAAAYYTRVSEQAASRAATEAARLAARNIPQPPQPSSRGGFRWPAKWGAFAARGMSVAPRSQRIVLVVSRSGVQAQLGEVEVRLSAPVDGSGKPGAAGGSPAKHMQTGIESFFASTRATLPPGAGGVGSGAANGQAAQARVLAAGVFAQLPLSTHVEALLAQVNLSGGASGTGGFDQSENELQAAIATSRAEARADAELQEALEASLATRPQAGREVSEEEQLQAALRASLRSKPEQPSVHSAADEDEQVRAAIALSLTHAKLSAGRSKTHGQADSSTAAIIDLSDSQPAEDLAEGDAADGAGKGGGVSEVRAVAQHSGQHSDQHSEQLSVLELREARLRRIHAAGRP